MEDERSQLGGGIKPWLHNADPKTRARAALAIGRMRVKALAPELKTLFSDKDKDVRGMAAYAAGLLGDPTLIPDLEGLLRMLEGTPGPKGVVLFSTYSRSVRPTDLQMRALASAAGAARASFYPVDAAGLVASARSTRLRVLSRLAVDTGGRETVNTNDLTLGAARAARDLGCRYTLGTYVRAGRKVSGSVLVDVHRRGVRALHPAGYRFD